MQTKSVLTALSLTMLFSSSAFSMMPRLALRQVARQAGRTSMRQLPGKGAPRRFLSDKVATSSTAKSRTKWSAGEKALLGVLVGTFGMVFGPMWNDYREHQAELEKEREKKRNKKNEIEYAHKLTKEVLEIIIKKQLPDEIVKNARTKTRTKYNKQMNYDEYPRERFCQLAQAFKEENPRRVSGHVPGGSG